MIRVLIAEDTPLMASVWAKMLDGQDGISVETCTADADDILEHLDADDIVLINTDLPDKNALTLIRTLKKANPDLKIVVTGIPESKHIVVKYIEVGAVGCVQRDAEADKLVEAIRLADAGEAIVSPEVTALLMHRVANLATLCDNHDIIPDETVSLTAREKEVLAAIGQGIDNEAMAEQLGVEIVTVKNYVHRVFSKLNVKTRRDAVSYLSMLRRITND